jgi:hypothetical protein
MKWLLFISLIISHAWPQDCFKPVLEESLSVKEIANLNCIFKNPLILGASVSHGQGTNEGGPAVMLARDYNPNTKPKMETYPGLGVDAILKNIKIPTPAPSSVMALDLFYWDAYNENCGDEVIKKIDLFFKIYQEQNIPMIVGALPLGVKYPAGYAELNNKVCAQKFNNYLSEHCKIENNCLIHNSADCTQAMQEKLKEDSKLKMFQDERHPTDLGNRICVDQFKASGKINQLNCY